MENINEMALFFIVSSIVVLVLGAMLIVSLFYVLRAVRNIKKTTEAIKDGVKLTVDGMNSAGEGMKKSGITWDLIASFLPIKKKKKRK
ncbi:MAG: hypothetical protein COU09_02850 [Candidatus Harrisonbacteria bacterium CG10_big_fil_rev_8_21_14_0_10_44_23]|uniref:Uncharacterized protein n=1 Tax=Candidatus Harrisonbacteria bacterium CG10_big_fil_rev_8_21_14_0_10_44_23 TaxID=1974585 RepID=A0A2H0UPJ0_9BACT|nr:MAG: hypothetical protein COU09_02850 [Candidatus Harrisonbacteria bacterium CG10_big_fil_rev_8_21_14_0_10_44_23]